MKNELSHNKPRQMTLIFDRVRGALSSILLMGIALAIAMILLFAWLADEVLEGETKSFDENVREFVHQLASPALTALMRVVTILGSTGFLITLGVIIAIIFLIIGWRRRIILFAVTMAGAAILNVTLKASFHRIRPVPFFDTPLPNSYSFPSGHALFSFCFYGVLAALIAHRRRPAAARIIVWSLATLLILLIGCSRIYLGVHYPSDVLAGYVAALIWVLAVALGYQILRRRKNDKRNLLDERITNVAKR